MDEKRICDYFVVAGIPTIQSTEATTFSREGTSPSLSPIGSSGIGLPPITDITVIIASQGETAPEGYHCIETTPLGFPADLNHGSLRTQNIFLCYKRGTDKPPLVDIGVLYEAKERVMSDSEVVYLTPYGKIANVNNGTSRTFLTYRRAKENAPCNQLVVIDICVVLGNKNENPPHAYCQINKNLNKGIIGSDVFICYKKSMNRPPLLRYEPTILERFPPVDHDSYSLPQSVPLFCMPMGATVECWPKKCQQPRPLFSTFVLTSNAAVKVYGAAITFYEKFDEDLLNEDEKSRLNFITVEDKAAKTLNSVKSICILSRWPFFETFEKFLTFLYHMTCCSPNVLHNIPIERYISHFMLDVPFPSVQRPKIQVQLGLSLDEAALLSQPSEDLPLPLSGASFTQFLRNLGPENSITVLLLVLAEQKILLHSLRPDVLTSVAEALTSLIFPFHWQCPYIPLCPLGLCDVLNAPLPFIVGVDSRYFDMYELPLDVACVDLDTNSIYISEHKKILNFKLLPKRPSRVLRNTLEKLYEKLLKPNPRTNNETYNPQSKSRNSTSPFSNDGMAARKRERTIDLEIQEIFVKFMASILKNFRAYLRPITKAPTIGATDPNSLFDFQDIDDSSHNDRTVFIPAPEPISNETYSYSCFPALDKSLFHLHSTITKNSFDQDTIDASNLSRTGSTAALASPMSRRTKQEIRSAQRVARHHSEAPLTWAKCLVSYCYSLWFIHLPAFVEGNIAGMVKAKQLRIAYSVLERMQSLNLHPVDEVCYRILMLLCGLYSQPILAVKVLSEMRRCGVTPNAITYGLYNKAVLESKWPSGDSSASLMWTKLRNVVLGIAKFKKCKKSAQANLISPQTIKEDDVFSDPPDESIVKSKAVTNLYTHQKISSNQSDAGYGSSIYNIETDLDTSTISVDTKIDQTKPVEIVNKKESKADRNLNEFRSMTRNIVRNSSSGPSYLDDYNSPAGVLMTSYSALNSESLNLSIKNFQSLRKRHKSEDQNQPTPVSPISTSSQCKSEPIKDSNRTSYFRSFSFGNDARIIHNLKEGTFKALKAEMEKNDPLKESSCSPSNERVIKGKNQTENDPSGIDKFRLTTCTEIPEEDPACDKNPGNETPDSQSSQQVSSKSGSRDESEEESDSDSNEEDKTFSFSPIKDHIMNMSIFSPEGRVASTLRSSFRLATRLAVGPTSSSKQTPPMTRSSTFHTNTSHSGLVRQKLSSKFNSLFKARSEETEESVSSKPSMTRSETAPPTSISSPCEVSQEVNEQEEKVVSTDNVSDETDEDKTSLNSYGYSPWTAKLASNKHIELVNSTIKSAANTMANRITGFKNTLASSATNSPSKVSKENSYSTGVSGPALLLSQFASLVAEKIPANFGYDDDDCQSLRSLDFKRHSIADSADDLRSREGSIAQNLVGFAFSQQKSNNYPPLFETIEKYYHEDLIPNNQSPPVIEIEITSCCRCHICSFILYDEEIMESWSADDSNLNTQCCFCNSRFVPLLTISLKILEETEIEDSLDKVLNNDNKTNETDETLKEDISENENSKSSCNDELSYQTQYSASYESIEPFTVPYLSPIVLRKELENVFESEGDSCVLKPEFVDDHPILYWNMLWYFERINLPSHIHGLCLHSTSLMKDKKDVDKYKNLDFRSVKIHCIWDNHKLHKDFERPMYGLWKETNETRSSLLHALVTDERKIQQNLMKQIIKALQCNDMISAMNFLINERLKQGATGNKKYYSMYRDLLYLSFVAMGRENIDQNYFDREYRRAHETLVAKYPSVLTEADQPPSLKAIFCRRIFKELELKPFENHKQKTII
uniref:UDENN domain-containing protein n=1 Tax=Tetranychus urticae TaxID=32264 RepID=T1KBU8_TETUR